MSLQLRKIAVLLSCAGLLTLVCACGDPMHEEADIWTEAVSEALSVDQVEAELRPVASPEIEDEGVFDEPPDADEGGEFEEGVEEIEVDPV
jgi:hypothetical protein